MSLTAGSNICAGKGEMGNYSRNVWVSLNLEWSPTVYRNSKNIVTFLSPVIQIKNLRNKWKLARSTFDFTSKDSSFRKGGKLAVYTTECSWMRPRLREEDLVSVPWSSIVHGRHLSALSIPFPATFFCSILPNERFSSRSRVVVLVIWTLLANSSLNGSQTSGFEHKENIP